jgi:MFS family permease
LHIVGDFEQQTMTDGNDNLNGSSLLARLGRMRAELGTWGRALRHRDYRLYFTGQIVSLLGTWVQKIALTWLIYDLTKKYGAVGLTTFAEQVPIFLVTGFAGVLADKWPKRTILLWTQALLLVQAALLAVLAYTGVIRPWHIIVLSGWLGFVRAMDVPARQSWVKELVSEVNDLPNAIALGSMSFNSARLVGPSLAAVAILVVTYCGGRNMAVTKQMAICFALNAASFLAVIWSIWRISAGRVAMNRKTTPVLEQLREGLSYARDHRIIRMLLMGMAFMGLFGMTYNVLLPGFADKVLHGGMTYLGYLQSSVGLGAICGAAYMASRKTVVGLKSKMVRGMAQFGCGLAGTALFGMGLAQVSGHMTLLLCMASLVVMGGGVMVFNSSTNTILQTVVDDDKRGRVMSLYTLALNGTAPMGGLAAGFLADHIGAPITMAICGGMVVLGSAVYWRQLPWMREQVRPIYVAKGIMPEVALGVEAATEAGAVQGKD